jgi:hypothetical protein
MAWPDSILSNPPPPPNVVAIEVLTDIVAICEARLSLSPPPMPPTPAAHRTLYSEIRAHALACMVNGAHGGHTKLIGGDGLGKHGQSDVDLAIMDLTKCRGFLLIQSPTTNDLLFALHEIDHSAPGGGGVTKP